MLKQIFKLTLAVVVCFGGAAAFVYVMPKHYKVIDNKTNVVKHSFPFTTFSHAEKAAKKCGDCRVVLVKH